MTRLSQPKNNNIEHPQSHYRTPDDLISDQDISFEQKIKALDIWEQDARQMLTASGEGMPGNEEGINRSNHHMLGQVERAKRQIMGKSPKQKASH